MSSNIDHVCNMLRSDGTSSMASQSWCIHSVNAMRSNARWPLRAIQKKAVHREYFDSNSVYLETYLNDESIVARRKSFSWWDFFNCNFRHSVIDGILDTQKWWFGCAQLHGSEENKRSPGKLNQAQNGHVVFFVTVVFLYWTEVQKSPLRRLGHLQTKYDSLHNFKTSGRNIRYSLHLNYPQ